MQRPVKNVKVNFGRYLPTGILRQQRINWRDHVSSADCRVVVMCNGQMKEYRLHLRILCRSSDFFFKVATGTVEAVQLILSNLDSDGSISIKMQDGSTASIGKSTDTLWDLKRHVCDAYDIPIENQRYFRIDGAKQTEIIDVWKQVSDFEQPLLFIPREPWQRVDNETKTVYLSLPNPCLEVFERILDFMYNYRCDDSCLQALGELNASSTLALLWLADRLDMPDLEGCLISHLEYTALSQTAHRYLATAVELGQWMILDALTQLAAFSLDSMPAGMCDGLPLEVVEGLLAGSCVS